MIIENKKTKTPRPNTVTMIDYDKTDAGSIMLSFLLFVVAVVFIFAMFYNGHAHKIKKPCETFSEQVFKVCVFNNERNCSTKKYLTNQQCMTEKER